MVGSWLVALRWLVWVDWLALGCWSVDWLVGGLLVGWLAGLVG